jgi:hypothetical protein
MSGNKPLESIVAHIQKCPEELRRYFQPVMQALEQLFHG